MLPADGGETRLLSLDNMSAHPTFQTPRRKGHTKVKARWSTLKIVSRVCHEEHPRAYSGRKLASRLPTVLKVASAVEYTA
jgi:hypothetical protein